jgi:hypothetical protein
MDALRQRLPHPVDGAAQPLGNGALALALLP